MKKLNTYHEQIQFTYELEKYQRISFIDVSIRRLTNGKLETTAFRKETNTDVYMNWNSHAPMQWKIGTLKNLVKRSIIICSDQHLLQKELDYLRKVFVEINDYPSKTVENIIKNETRKKKMLISRTNHRSILLTIAKQSYNYLFHSLENKVFSYYLKCKSS